MNFQQRNGDDSDFESSSEHSAHKTENYGECRMVDIISFQQNDDKNDSQSTLFCTAISSKLFSSLTSLSKHYLKTYCLEQISDEKKGGITKPLQQLEHLSYDLSKDRSLNQNNETNFDSTSHSQNEYILHEEMSPLKCIPENKMLTEKEESEIGTLQTESAIWDIVNSVLKEIYKRNEKNFSDINILEETEYETFKPQYTSPTLMEPCLTDFVNKFIKLDKNVRKTLQKTITNILINYFTQSDDLIVESITEIIVSNAKLLQRNQSHYQKNKSYVNILSNNIHETNPEVDFVHKLLFEMVIQTFEILENIDKIWMNALVNSSDMKNLSSFSGLKDSKNLKNKDEHPPYTLMPKDDDDIYRFPIIYLKSKNSTIRDDTWQSSNVLCNRSHKIITKKNDSLIRKPNLTQKKHCKNITAAELSSKDVDLETTKLPRIKHISPTVKSTKMNMKVPPKYSEKHRAKSNNTFI